MISGDALVQILDILDVRIAETTETMLAAIREPSQIKWSLAAVCAVLLLSLFIRKPKTS